MVKKNTRLVPVDHSMFAPPSSGVTLIGNDDKIWQSTQGQSNLVGVDRSVAVSAAPALDPADFMDEIRMGSNRTLYQAVLDKSGKAKWQPITDMKPDMALGFKLPLRRENDAVLEDAALDDQGIVLGQFVGSYASYWRMNAIRAYWNGSDLYTDDGKYLNCPDSFKRGFPATMGLDGLVYIPREDYIEDLLIPETVQDSGTEAYHKVEKYPELNVSNGGRGTRHCHNVTNRKVGDQNARKTFESAWDAAIFEVVDIYTEPNKTFEERRLILETTVKPLQDAYKHLRLLPVNPILSKSWAQNAYDTLPSDAALVFVDPSSKYDGATTERGLKPRKKVKKSEKGAPLVGWKLDASGRLDTLIVEGTDQEKSAINVGEGNLWVCDKEIYDAAVRNSMDYAMKRYNQKMSEREAQITRACGGNAEFLKSAKEAFRKDATANALSIESCTTNHNENIEAFIQQMCQVPSHITMAAEAAHPGNAAAQRIYLSEHCILGVETQGVGTLEEKAEITRRLNLIEVLRSPVVGYAPTDAQRLAALRDRQFVQRMYVQDIMRDGIDVATATANIGIARAVNLALASNRAAADREAFLTADSAITAVGGRHTPMAGANPSAAERAALLAAANAIYSGVPVRAGDADVAIPAAIDRIDLHASLRGMTTRIWEMPSNAAQLGAIGITEKLGRFKSTVYLIANGLMVATMPGGGPDNEAQRQAADWGGRIQRPDRPVDDALPNAISDYMGGAAGPVEMRIRALILDVLRPRHGQSVPGNIHSWNDKQRAKYAELFPIGCLVSYKMKKGEKIYGEQDSYYMTRIVIV